MYNKEFYDYSLVISDSITKHGRYYMKLIDKAYNNHLIRENKKRKIKKIWQ